jgi:uncharacterized protein (AIM24 family)
MTNSPELIKSVDTEASRINSSYGSKHGEDIQENVLFKQLAELEGKNSIAKIFQFNQLSGAMNEQMAEQLTSLQNANVRLKQAQLILEKGTVFVKPGLLNYMVGDIRIELVKRNPIREFFKAVFSKVRASPYVIYKGSGEIFLEPTFGQLFLLFIRGEDVIVDRDMFCAAEDSVKINRIKMDNLATTLWGGEGTYQIKLNGRGWCLLRSNIPLEEIRRYTLEDDKLTVDGNFAILRKGGIKFTVERSHRSLFGSFRTGEKLLQTFSGTGEVWIVPTEPVYSHLQKRKKRKNLNAFFTIE